MAKLLVLNGPNLNLLGKREPQHYGATRLVDIEQQLISNGKQSGHDVECFQSNAEHELVNRSAGRAYSMMNSGWPNSTGWPFST